MHSTPTKPLSSDELAFLQHRVARFGLFGAALSAVFWLFRLVEALGSIDPSRWIFEPTFGLHALAWASLLGIWALNRSGERSRTFINTVETVGLVGACLAYVAMGAFISLVNDPAMIVLVAIIAVIVARAAYVPGTAPRTFGICVAVGIPYIGVTYATYSAIEPGLLAEYSAAEYQRVSVGISVERLRTTVTANAAVWWMLYTALATGITHVIYGLRRQVRDVKKLGEYTLEEKIGEGGMGVVYRAHHGMLRRPTAIKLLKAGKSNEAAIERFAREVRLTARLTHPNTVTIYDYGRTPEGLFYYAMELLEGADLREVVAVDGPQAPGRVVKVLSEVASALTEAHGVGLIHRDIKPANIILSFQGGMPDVAKVVDFGLVKELDREGIGESELAKDHAITGTPQYMAPESITTPDQVDARSDLYALGAVGYFLLTGTHVFSAMTIVEICADHLHTEPEPPSARLGPSAPAIPADLEALILECLQKDPTDRPQTAAALSLRLQELSSAGSWKRTDASAWWDEFRGALDERRGVPDALGEGHTLDVALRVARKRSAAE